jgi:hypothetical protein
MSTRCSCAMESGSDEVGTSLLGGQQDVSCAKDLGSRIVWGQEVIFECGCQCFFFLIVNAVV